MQPLYFLVLLVTLVSGSLAAQQKDAYNAFIDVQHYHFAIELNDASNSIKGNAAIKVAFLRSTREVSFDLIRKNAKGKGMMVNAVRFGQAMVAYEQTSGLLKIRLGRPAAPGDTGTFIISYSGSPADGLVFSKNKYKQRTIFADNWPNRARNWLPCVDHVSDKAGVEFLVTAPAHYKVISNGELVEESALEGNRRLTHWKETVALPTKVMVIGLADFAINYAGQVDCIPVSSWVFPPDKKNGFYDYAQALEILPFFIKEVGPYAYKKLANVEAITIFGGMENAGAIFYNERSITGERRYSEELMAHEIAHQWFGNSATESGWPHVWLSEGFATEMTNLYLEKKYGTDTLEARLKADRQVVIDFAKERFTPIVDSSEKSNFLLLLNHNSYEKAGWVLHMLRRKLGDSLFRKGVRNYYAAFAGGNASTSDFQQVMEDVSQTSLGEFFHQWFYRPGHPVLDIKWEYDAGRKMLVLHIIQQQEMLFSFPIEFAFKTSGVVTNETRAFLVRDKITAIEIPMDDKPTLVIPDPATNLLFQDNAKE